MDLRDDLRAEPRLEALLREAHRLPAVFRADFFFGAVLLFVADFRFVADFFAAPFFLGTLAPSLRASERAMAIACFRLVTFLPLPPLRSVPLFFSRITSSTFSPARFEYFAIDNIF